MIRTTPLTHPEFRKTLRQVADGGGEKMGKTSRPGRTDGKHLRKTPLQPSRNRR